MLKLVIPLLLLSTTYALAQEEVLNGNVIAVKRSYKIVAETFAQRWDEEKCWSWTSVPGPGTPRRTNHRDALEFTEIIDGSTYRVQFYFDYDRLSFSSEDSDTLYWVSFEPILNMQKCSLSWEKALPIIEKMVKQIPQQSLTEIIFRPDFAKAVPDASVTEEVLPGLVRGEIENVTLDVDSCHKTWNEGECEIASAFSTKIIQHVLRPGKKDITFKFDLPNGVTARASVGPSDYSTHGMQISFYNTSETNWDYFKPAVEHIVEKWNSIERPYLMLVYEENAENRVSNLTAAKYTYTFDQPGWEDCKKKWDSSQLTSCELEVSYPGEYTADIMYPVQARYPVSPGLNVSLEVGYGEDPAIYAYGYGSDGHGKHLQSDIMFPVIDHFFKDLHAQNRSWFRTNYRLK